MLPCIGLTAFDADGSGAPNAILVDTSDVNSASTAASGMRKLTKLINFIVLIFASGPFNWFIIIYKSFGYDAIDVFVTLADL